jgi:hypothetical protein
MHVVDDEPVPMDEAPNRQCRTICFESGSAHRRTSANVRRGLTISFMDNLTAFPDMLSALRAGGPEPSLASELSLFGQFVGIWNLEIDFWPRDAPAWSTDGVWIFGWILDGRGIQDVILHTNRAGHIGRGTTVRLHDPVEEIWQMAFFGPVSRTYVMLTAHQAGESVLVEGVELDDLLRWSLHDITGGSFLWRGHISADGGATWHYEQEMRATRASTSSERLRT